MLTYKKKDLKVIIWDSTVLKKSKLNPKQREENSKIRAEVNEIENIQKRRK